MVSKIATLCTLLVCLQVGCTVKKQDARSLQDGESVKAVSEIGTRQLMEVFSDFEFVGDFPLAETTFSHSTEIKPFPTTIETNRQYVFHHPNPADNDSLFTELQNRLRSKGSNVLDAKGDLYANADGLQFHILFQHEKYCGEIENRIDHQIASSRDAFLRERLFIDDYILPIAEAKDTAKPTAE